MNEPMKAPGDHRQDHQQRLPGVFGRHHKKSPTCVAKGTLRDVALDVLSKGGGPRSKAAQHWLKKDPFDKAVLEGECSFSPCDYNHVEPGNIPIYFLVGRRALLYQEKYITVPYKRRARIPRKDRVNRPTTVFLLPRYSHPLP